MSTQYEVVFEDVNGEVIGSVFCPSITQVCTTIINFDLDKVKCKIYRCSDLSVIPVQELLEVWLSA